MGKKKSNGEGTIYKTNTGYRGQVVIGYDEYGKAIRQSVRGKTKGEVRDKIVGIQNSILTGLYVAPDNITICDLAKQMLEEELKLNYIKEGTFGRNTETLKRIENNAVMKNTPIQKITEIQIKQYLLEETKMSQSVINKIYIMLNKTMREAVKRRVIVENPMLGVKKPKSAQSRDKVRALTTDEEKKLYKVLVEEDVQYSWQMLLSMFTGMRMGEINALTKQDINLKARTICIDKTMARDLKGTPFISNSPKTDAGRRILPISDTVLPIITEILNYCGDSEYLFLSKDRLVTTSQVNMQFKRTIAKYDIIDKNVKGKVSLHSLRHTYATRCIEAGMQAMALKKLLGHTDIKVTMNTYCDAFENYQKENISKADEYFADMGFSYPFNL